MEYTKGQWYEPLLKALGVESLIVQQRGLMDRYDPLVRPLLGGNLAYTFVPQSVTRLEVSLQARLADRACRGNP